MRSILVLSRNKFYSWIKTFIDFILPVARRFYSPVGVGWAHITNLDAPMLDELQYMSTRLELLTCIVVPHKIFTLDEVTKNANSDKIWKNSDQRNMLVCLFVC